MRDEANVVHMHKHRQVCEGCALKGECLATDSSGEGSCAYDIPVVPRIYRRRERVFRAGEVFGSVYVVRSGVVKTYVIAPNGDQQVVGFHYAGDLIGLDAVEKGTYVCNAQALDTASLCALPFDKLSRLCMHSTTVHSRLMRTISREFQRDKSLLFLLGQMTADQRIAAFLLDVSEVQARLGYSALEFNLAMPRSDIASYLSLAVETVSRVLSRLQDAGVIDVNRTQVRICDYIKLVELVDEDRKEALVALH